MAIQFDRKSIPYSRYSLKRDNGKNSIKYINDISEKSI